MRAEASVACGVLVEVDTDDADVARAAARWAMREHVYESCDGIDVLLPDAVTEEATPVVAWRDEQGVMRFDWGAAAEALP